jgi:excisionase family DNA binding protein
MTGLDAAKLMALLERLATACERLAGQALRPAAPAAGSPETTEPEWLGPKEMGRLLGCSYGETRRRMLDGRLRAVKDGRWLRSRREWVEEYLEGKVVKPPKKGEVVVTGPSRKKRAASVEVGGTALEFLRERQK